ncbi:leucine-rich repeat and calponin homology domain-containing protein 1 [Patella vulgata]|uniref:leucine-rich repeat and calponin homology domain-containing protein 1 n=1 Tax=Patella vulgata TaxID=6465 RepID=UPI0021809456|nr:leucine-rich repeat and calponin homology domain-containing protein 1 [Patella vulgata]
MAATYGSGGSSPPVIGRPVERVFEEAQTTGEINLSGRKLKDYPRKSPKYDLADTIAADLSKNRLQEFPQEICEYSSIEKINCYHNCIKSIPETIIHLQQLTHLNLSRNQLTVLPSYIGGLISLEVLIAANNKLVSLPEEIGMLEKLMELDVSCNEISHLPLQLGDLSSLRSLNVRRNFLVELPLGG